MKLIIEKPLVDIQAYAISEITESTGLKCLHVEGPMLGAEVDNKNNRNYALPGMIEAVNEYRETMIKTGLSVGELNHPESPAINYERATHLVTELRQEGNVFIGKAKILQGVHFGDLVAGLIRNGVKVGMSSRALGEIQPMGNGVDRVVRMHLRAIDAVSDPSFSKAFVNGIMESCEFVKRQGENVYIPVYERFEKRYNDVPKHNTNLKDEAIIQNIEAFFKELREAGNKK